MRDRSKNSQKNLNCPKSSSDGRDVFWRFESFQVEQEFLHVLVLDLNINSEVSLIGSLNRN